MITPAWVRIYRFAFALLAIAALVGKLLHDDDSFANFLSKFTVEANALAAVVLLLGAALPSETRATPRWSWLRGAAVTYLIVTFIVYGTLLGGFTNPFTTDRHWNHTVLHQVIPVVMVADLLLRPFVARVPWKSIAEWAIYPVLFLGYSLVRGAVVDWYPYDFIDPREVGGYDGVTLYSLGVTAGFVIVGIAVLLLGERQWLAHRERRMHTPLMA